MIISASYRTDIPALYGTWFENRLDAGYVEVKNPYNQKYHSVSLKALDVTGFWFWTRNPIPFKPQLAKIKRHYSDTPFAVTMTILGYPRLIDRSVPSIDEAIAGLSDVARDYGKNAIVWRYDPVLITNITTREWHLDNFKMLAAKLSPHTTEVVMSFAQIYKKSAKNLNSITGLQKTGEYLNWADPDDDFKRSMLGELADIASDYGLKASLCSQDALLTPAISPARCIDVDRLSLIANRDIHAKVKGNRDGCLCHQSKDIGSYDLCPQGCSYCYANHSRQIAQQNNRAHNPNSPYL